MLGTVIVDKVYECDVISLENEGKGVCKIGGMVVFVPKVLPGEKVRIRITEKKKNYARGKLIEILNSSIKRVESACPYYDLCGGCNLRHQTKEENLIFKKEKVKTALEKFGKLDIDVEDVIPSVREENYRNKASFKVEDDKIGFYEEGTYRLINIRECMLCNEEINRAFRIIKRYIEFNINDIKDITIKHGNLYNELLVDIRSTSNSDVKIVDYLINNISNVKTIVFNDKLVYGNGYIREIIDGLVFNVSSKSFFQVNDSTVKTLYETAIKLAKLKKKDIVLDLYSGTGTIASLVSKHVKEVIGIEIVEDAVKDAKENFINNHINNVKMICSDVSKEIINIQDYINVIFIDPPRKGIDRKTIAVMKKIGPEKIIYISCNPVTMARDLSYLNDMYDVKKVVPIDMFPNTEHVECVCVLEIRK